MEAVQPTAATVRAKIPGGQVDAGTLLIVRHGPGRGPRVRLRAFRPRYLERAFDDLARRAPALGRAIRQWETGHSLPDLDSVHAIVFLLGDPLRELFPDCHEEAERLAEMATTRGIRLINPPSALSNSIKSVQARRWRDAGIPCAEQFRFASRDELMALIDKVPFPALLRPDLHHAQASMFHCETAEDVHRLNAETIRYPGTLTPFVDCREGYRRVAPGTPWATHYHKKRILVFGDHVRTNHVFFSERPIVGLNSSTFGYYRSLNPVRRAILGHRYRTHFDCDNAFWELGSEHEELMVRAVRTLGLDLGAIDYATRADGSPVLWELNPNFALHMWPFEILPRRRRLKERMPSFHDALIDFLEDVLQCRS